MSLSKRVFLGASLLLTGCEVGLVHGPSGPAQGLDSLVQGSRNGDPAEGPEAGQVLCEPPAYGGKSLVLSDIQLSRTLESLFPFEVVLPDLPTRLRPKHGFSTATIANEFTFASIADIAAAAEEIAAQAYDHLDEMLPCTLGSNATQCVEQFVREFGAKAFRRPLEAEEVDIFTGLFTQLTNEGSSDEIATCGVIAAVLQSPQFLYQLDLGTPGDNADEFELTSYELAAHLAFLLTDAPPDEELLSLAESDALRDPEVLRGEAKRLMGTQAGRETLFKFISEWFDVEGLDMHGRVDADLADAMHEQFHRNVEAWLEGGEDSKVSDLLGSSQSYINGTLVEHYGLTGDMPTAADDWREVELPGHYQGGLLTNALVAAQSSSLEKPSVILRGVFVLQELLCSSLGTPPNNAVDANPDLPPEATPRERIEARGKIEVCAGCHDLIDPVGIGMEDIDQLGRFRDQYESGMAVDSAGSLAFFTDSEFSGTAALAKRLASSPELTACAATQWVEYTMGAGIDKSRCSVQSLSSSVTNGSGSFEQLVLDYLESPTFLSRVRNAEGG